MDKPQYSFGFEAIAAQQRQARALADASVAQEWELDWCKRAVAEVGRKNFIAIVKTQESVLSECLSGGKKQGGGKDDAKKQERPMRAEWVTILVSLVGDELREEYLRRVAGGFGFVIQRPRVLEPAEELAWSKQFLARRAPDVLEAMERERIKEFGR